MATGRGTRKSIYSPGYEKVLTLLRETRLDAGLTQAQLCERLRRPRNYVSKCESGERRVDVLEWAEFLAGCGADPVTFLVRLAQSGVIHPPLQVSAPAAKTSKSKKAASL
jgi:transcriptional regulator with XRE-family HTH domain